MMFIIKIIYQQDPRMTFLEPPDPTTDCRCLCGSLIARRVERGVELKCRRCKRTVFVPVSEVGAGGFRPVQSLPAGRAG